MDEMDLTAAESKATYEEIKKYVAEHNDGMKVSNLYIAQVMAKHGIIERENYNLPKSEEARQPKCPKEKEEAIVWALKYFQMIPSEEWQEKMLQLELRVSQMREYRNIAFFHHLLLKKIETALNEI